MHRLREELTEEDLSSAASDSRNKRQKMDRKIDIADRVSCGLVRTCLNVDSFQPPTDFFGRPITVKPVSKPVSQVGLTKTASLVPVVSYKFNEGNSAAVRKPVKVSSFL